MKVVTGRGVTINPPNRFEKLHFEFNEEESGTIKTTYYQDHSASFITYNDSPDVCFTASINPYRGCEHGCVYCYARPMHEYLGFSSGSDFESRIMVKMKAPEILRRELNSPKWKPQSIALSGATDCYQPIERYLQLTRQCLQVLANFRNPVGIITKSHLITRDIDILQELTRYQAVSVNISLTTLDSNLVRLLEPRAAFPEHRLNAITALAQAGIPVNVLMAPIIPGLTDHEIPKLLEAAAAAGAKNASYVILRLPHAVENLFVDWLETHFPEKKNRILTQLKAMRNGKLNDPTFHHRMTGDGPLADHISQLFNLCVKRFNLDQPSARLSTRAFRRSHAEQLQLL